MRISGLHHILADQALDRSIFALALRAKNIAARWRERHRMEWGDNALCEPKVPREDLTRPALSLQGGSLTAFSERARNWI